MPGFPTSPSHTTERYFAVTTPENRIELRRWDDLELVAEVVCPTEEESGLVAIDLSPDGRWIAVADSCERLHLIDRTSGQLVATTDAGEGTLLREIRSVLQSSRPRLVPSRAVAWSESTGSVTVD